MKIAFITDDGKQISRHFGRASHYLVVEVEDGKIVGREMREKLGHRNFAAQGGPHQPPAHPDPGHEPPKGHDHHDPDHQPPKGKGQPMHGMESHGKHVSMAEVIGDCDAIICGGMGMGAYQSMQSLGITPVVTEKIDIDEAFQAYIRGELKDQTDMLH